MAWTTVTVPKKKEAKPFYDLPSDPRLSHGVELRFTNGDHQNMSVHLQAVPQGNQPDPSWASRNTGALLRRFTGTSLPNSKVVIDCTSTGTCTLTCTHPVLVQTTMGHLSVRVKTTRKIAGLYLRGRTLRGLLSPNFWKLFP